MKLHLRDEVPLLIPLEENVTKKLCATTSDGYVPLLGPFQRKGNQEIILNYVCLGVKYLYRPFWKKI